MASVLIVDDASFMRGSLKFIVESAGHKVSGMAKDGREALKLYKRIKPDVVAVMITAYREEMEDIVAKAIDHGAYGCLYKPFGVDKVIDLVEKVTNKIKGDK